MKNLRSTTATSFMALTAAALLFTVSSCKRDDEGPQPVEQEVITTIKLSLRGPGTATTIATYIYKVQNGFNSTSPGTIQADTIRLAPGADYLASIEVLNENATPAEAITEEIIEEKDAHLFLYVSDPVTGAGSVAFSAGQKDGNGKPFNLTGTITAGSTGSGTLHLYLLHEPANKDGLTPDVAAGETDAAAAFPVLIQ